MVVGIVSFAVAVVALRFALVVGQASCHGRSR